jgi:hypothetical protein
LSATASRRDSKERLRLEITARAIKELGLVYSNPLDGLREFIQNAVDAGATSISILYDKESKQLVFEHNGEPIEGEYLDAFLTVGTDFKARQRDKYIGMYGIGRLSWLMLGHTAVIETGSNKLVWKEDNIDVIEREPLGEYYKGVRWIIHLRDSINFSEYEIEDYIRNNYHGNVPIFLNGRQVDLLRDNAVPIFSDGVNEVYYTQKTYTGVIIKGIFTVGTDFYLERLLIKTSDPRVKINPARQIVWDDKYKEWRSYIARMALRSIVDKYGPEKAANIFGIHFLAKLAETAFPISYFHKEHEAKKLLWERVNHLVFKTADNTYVRGSELDPKTWVYSDLEVTDTTRSKLVRKGVRIVYVNDSYVMEWLKKLGFRHVRDFVVEEKAKRVIVGDVEEKLRAVYDEIQKIVANTVKTHRAVIREPAIRTKDGVYTAHIRQLADALEVTLVSKDARAPRIHTVKVKIVGKLEGFNVYFVEYTDKDTLAFTDRNNIYINVNNPKVGDLILKTKRTRNKWKLLLLWSPILVHEMVHQYGFEHTDPEWHQIYEDILQKINETIAENLFRRKTA